MSSITYAIRELQLAVLTGQGQSPCKSSGSRGFARRCADENYRLPNRIMRREGCLLLLHKVPSVERWKISSTLSHTSEFFSRSRTFLKTRLARSACVGGLRLLENKFLGYEILPSAVVPESNSSPVTSTV
jgi:hypothetical protein